MSVVPARDDIPQLHPEGVQAAIARLDEKVSGIRDDVADIKISVDRFDERLSYLADVRVKGLEDREIRQKAIADERARVASRGWNRWEKLAATLTGLILAATAVASLILQLH